MLSVTGNHAGSLVTKKKSLQKYSLMLSSGSSLTFYSDSGLDFERAIATFVSLFISNKLVGGTGIIVTCCVTELQPSFSWWADDLTFDTRALRYKEETEWGLFFQTRCCTWNGIKSEVKSWASNQTFWAQTNVFGKSFFF